MFACFFFKTTDLLETLEKNGTSASGNTEDGHTRKRTKSDEKSPSTGAEKAEYTKDQVEAVDR